MPKIETQTATNQGSTPDGAEFTLLGLCDVVIANGNLLNRGGLSDTTRDRIAEVSGQAVADAAHLKAGSPRGLHAKAVLYTAWENEALLESLFDDIEALAAA